MNSEHRLARVVQHMGSAGSQPEQPVDTRPSPCLASVKSKGAVTLLDYGAGNVRSVRNAIIHCGYDVIDVQEPADILKATKLIFPGVGSFGFCMKALADKGYIGPLKEYIAQNRPLLGVCLGMQLFFEESEETPGVAGLAVVPGKVTRFTDTSVAVPHMGWNNARAARPESTLLAGLCGDDGQTDKVYFVHSFCALPTARNHDWVLTTTDYGSPDQTFISAIQKGNVMATQFHPEKSGTVGLTMFENFLKADSIISPPPPASLPLLPRTTLARRVIACLDIRSNDDGDLVVTKGQSYDVREKKDGNAVRNLGLPVELAGRYYAEGADEITFLNITAFRDETLADMPLMEMLQQASQQIFVPLCIGGGIRDYTDKHGTEYTALEVASSYFRAGADKVSLGSDAVLIAEEYYNSGKKTPGTTAIETISYTYGAQAVVISVDPKRQYLHSPEDVPTPPGKLPTPVVLKMADIDVGPNGERYAWYACTIKGGRETRPLDAFALAAACEALGAGEILLNCIDKDGTNSGFDVALVAQMKAAVSIPVIASSGAGSATHFVDIFQQTDVEAALAAGIFHRREVPISDVKESMVAANLQFRVA
eukprot:SAG31_NODE_3643_length_4030_cov_3.758586_4_plen_595_part_00